ncbi:MAG: glycosyltransferase [Candidatus Hodarchaeota archaeon]
MAIKILHLISTQAFLGAENVVLELTREIRPPDYHSTIGIVAHPKNKHLEFAHELTENNLDFNLFQCRGRFDPKLILSLRNFMNKNNTNILHCHGYKANIYGIIAAKNNTKTITTNHLWKRSTLPLKLYCFLDSIIIRFFDRITAVSDEIREEMIRKRIDSSRIIVIDNGVCIERFCKDSNGENIRNEFNIPTETIIAGVVGSLSKEKGHIYLLKSFKEVLEIFPKLKLLIVGDGYLRGELKNKVREWSIENNVIFTGTRKDIPKILSSIDIFVLPSLKEGLPMVLLEAMASKKPIIATRVGGVPKAIKNNESGILIESKDAVGLKKALINLLKDKDKAELLGTNAYKMAKNRFSSKIMAQKYISLYEELVNNPQKVFP